MAEMESRFAHVNSAGLDATAITGSSERSDHAARQVGNPARGAFWQVVFLGGTFLVIGSVTDSIYALALGRAGRYLSQKRVRLMSRISGGFLIGGAVWLALKR